MTTQKKSAAQKSDLDAPMTSDEEANPETWADTHGDYLFRYALFKISSKETAEELVQDTFISAINALASFENRSSIRTWLKTILHNKIIDHVRKRNRENSVSYDEISFEERPSAFNSLGIWKEIVPSWGRNPELVLADKRFGEVLQDCLLKLPEKLRVVFTMRIIDEIDSKDICKDLDITSSNFWVIMHRSRLALQKCLEKNWLGR